jgi:hypothetical protein
MEASEAGTADPDNVLVEYSLDGGTTWMVAVDYIMDGVSYLNGQWYMGCFQVGIPVGTSTMALRFNAGGDTGHTDFIYLDDVSLAGRPRATPPPTMSPPGATYECVDDTTSWSIMFSESFEYSGADNIGSIFVFGGTPGDDDSVKVATGTPGTVSHTGTRAIKLKDNSDASRIYSVPQDVSLANRLELTFWFKFRGMDELDNIFVEYRYNSDTAWTVASDVVKVGSNYLNEVWYQHCIQWDLPASATHVAIQVRADGQEGDSDIVFVDDVALKAF